MAKYDYGGGCSCGLYKECDPDCYNHPDQEAARFAKLVRKTESLIAAGHLRTCAIADGGYCSCKKSEILGTVIVRRKAGRG